MNPPPSASSRNNRPSEARASAPTPLPFATGRAWIALAVLGIAVCFVSAVAFPGAAATTDPSRSDLAQTQGGGAQGSSAAAGTVTNPPGQIVRLLAVGSVLTADGGIWLYRPDRGRWMTVDDAFKEDGRTTHVLPLPVPVDSIREMITFGFLLTDTGECWLYLMDKDRWEKLPTPR
jgi:hypothetical protein